MEEYLFGKGSTRFICAKYNISSTKTLRNWIKQYNSNMKLTDYDPKPEVYMAAARRKTIKDAMVKLNSELKMQERYQKITTILKCVS